MTGISSLHFSLMPLVIGQQQPFVPPSNSGSGKPTNPDPLLKGLDLKPPKIGDSFNPTQGLDTQTQPENSVVSGINLSEFGRRLPLGSSTLVRQKDGSYSRVFDRNIADNTAYWIQGNSLYAEGPEGGNGTITVDTGEGPDKVKREPVTKGVYYLNGENGVGYRNEPILPWTKSLAGINATPDKDGFTYYVNGVGLAHYLVHSDTPGQPVGRIWRTDGQLYTDGKWTSCPNAPPGTLASNLTIPINNSALNITNPLDDQVSQITKRLLHLKSCLSGNKQILSNGYSRIYQGTPVPFTDDERNGYTREIARLEAEIQQQQRLLRQKVVELTCWQVFMHHPAVNKIYNNNHDQFRNNFIIPQLNALTENTSLDINNNELKNLRARIYQNIANNNSIHPSILNTNTFCYRANTPPEILEAFKSNISINLGTRVLGSPGESALTTVFCYINKEGNLIVVSFRGREFNRASTQLQCYSAHVMDIAYAGQRVPEGRRKNIQVTINDKILSRHSHHGGGSEEPNIRLSDNAASQNEEFMSWFCENFLEYNLTKFPSLLAPASRFGESRYRPFPGLLSEFEAQLIRRGRP